MDSIIITLAKELMVFGKEVYATYKFYLSSYVDAMFAISCVMVLINAIWDVIEKNYKKEKADTEYPILNFSKYIR